jgi:hypothetical protein
MKKDFKKFNSIYEKYRKVFPVKIAYMLAVRACK